MLINPSSEIESKMFEGPLEFSNIPPDDESSTRSIPTRGEIQMIEPPVITIGEPLVWNIAEVYRNEGKVLPSTIGLMLREADFFLVQLACSFKVGKNTHVDWARFSTFLRPRNPDTNTPKPIALDLHPVEVFDSIQRKVRVAISPSLKFAEIAEASIGEVALEVQYNELTPRISASGPQESNFSWDLQKTSGYPVRGARFFHALLKRPHGTEGIRASFEIKADVVTTKGLLRFGTKSSQSESLSRLICV